MSLTNLSTIINRMNAYQIIANIEEQYKVRYLDEAIRGVRRDTQFPWMLQKSTIKVFEDVLEYPVAADHDELAYIDRDGDSTLFRYEDRARFKFTSLQQFYEDTDYRNQMAEIWNGNTRYLGIRYNMTSPDSTIVNNAETVGQFTATGDASTPAFDQVTFREGQGSIRFSIVNASGTAAISNSSTATNDSNYKKKWYFRYIFLPAVPTSIELRYGSDSSNYLSGVLTKQFSGQPLQSNQWNTLAFDLSTATIVGSTGTPTGAYEDVVFTGAPTGTYYIDASYTRQWEQLDYWYYSKFNVALVGQTAGNQEYFYNSSEAYSTDSQIIADTEWVDVIMYDAMLSACMEKNNDTLYKEFLDRRTEAWKQLMKRYPSLSPLITTDKYRFGTDFFIDEQVWLNT